MIDVYQGVGLSAVVGSLIFTAKTFIRLRKSEQVKLVESIVRDVSQLTNQFNLLNAEDPQDQIEIEILDRKVHRLMDHIFGGLDWFAFLVETKEINDKKLVGYYKGKVIEWYDTFFRKYFPDLVDDPTKFQYFQRLYKKYKNEIEKENK